MAYKTKLQVEQKVKRDLDLEEEAFIQADELTEYVNDAITIIEAQINTLGLRDNYFLTRTTLSLVSGQADYSMPSNIFQDQIKEVTYSNGTTIYNMTPITQDKASEEIEHLNEFQTTDYYKYRVRNDASNDINFQIAPPARETVADVVVIEYYRDLERVTLDADLVELPEICLQYLYQYVKTMIYEKEAHALYGVSLQKLEKLEGLMVSTLTGQLKDSNENLLQFDKSIYEESS